MEHEGMGGSYIRQQDGSLKLVARTEDPAPLEIDPGAAAGSAPAQTNTPASRPAKQKED